MGIAAQCRPLVCTTLAKMGMPLFVLVYFFGGVGGRGGGNRTGVPSWFQISHVPYLIISSGKDFNHPTPNYISSLFHHYHYQRHHGGSWQPGRERAGGGGERS